jgi:hypothetical protein
MDKDSEEIPLSEPMPRAWLDPTERSVVHRKGDVVLRDTGEWSSSVHAFLRHIDSVGFDAAPKVVGSGISDDGREQLSYIEGDVINPQPWSVDGVRALARMIRELHEASSSFGPDPDAIWPPYFGRTLGSTKRIVSHCDLAPWNVVSKNGLPVGLIDWEYAGPVDPNIELALAAWQNLRLFSDDVAEKENLASVETRAEHLHEFVNAYELDQKDRTTFIDTMIEYIVHDVAFQADEVGVTEESVSTDGLWGMAWRSRSAVWLLNHRQIFEQAISD